MSTERLRQLLATSWWKLLAGLLIGALLAVPVLAIAPKEYTSTARVLVQSTPSDEARAADQQTYIDSMLPTFIALAESDSSLGAIAKASGDGVDEQDVRDGLTYEADSDSAVITITGTGDTPKTASTLTEAAAETFVDQTPDASGAKDTTVQILEQASAAKLPSSPDPLVVGPALMILGLLAAFLLALLSPGRRRPPRSARELAYLADAPVLGTLAPRGARLHRDASRRGLPTTAAGIGGRVRRLGDPMIALVGVGSIDERAFSALQRSASAAEPDAQIRTGARSGAEAETVIRRLELTDELSELPAGAGAVLVVSAACSVRTLQHAARFARGHGVRVRGVVVASAEAARDLSRHRGVPAQELGRIDERLTAADPADPADPEDHPARADAPVRVSTSENS
ncbi:Wzz/FepE/Etk N-terminal domain-containing protein [Brachybacterium kimchii]|uniref:Wzz/FepE/Etk N-terminal domain-containing protein n=1 Tax=Brachybacterium kimchii TaxID=2942909 RepID=A0ABY4N2X9_9MICO|nr:Wzz/FepE/Etk N-terminal domain-containing protein [Brachybacterium kimchii]UQN28456.1 Wzz/FepE/Etk N-terminal domain-containing protein [Brachybacterium kimchii]